MSTSNLTKFFLLSSTFGCWVWGKGGGVEERVTLTELSDLRYRHLYGISIKMECKKCSCAFFDPNPFRQNVCKNCQHPRNEHAEKQTSQEHSTRLHYIEVAAHKEKGENFKLRKIL